VSFDTPPIAIDGFRHQRGVLNDLGAGEVRHHLVERGLHPPRVGLESTPVSSRRPSTAFWNALKSAPELALIIYSEITRHRDPPSRLQESPRTSVVVIDI
jgi:hypothetical protein